jgi:hypothetical protein
LTQRLASLSPEALAEDPVGFQRVLEQLFDTIAQGDADAPLIDALQWLLPPVPHAPASGAVWSAAMRAAHRLTPVQRDYFIAHVLGYGDRAPLTPEAEHAWRELCLSQALRRSLVDPMEAYQQLGCDRPARPAPPVPAAPDWGAQLQAVMQAIPWTHFVPQGLVQALHPLLHPAPEVLEALAREGAAAAALRLQRVLVAALQPGCLVSMDEVHQELLSLQAPHLAPERLPIDMLMVLCWVQDASIEAGGYDPSDELIAQVLTSLARYAPEVQAQALCAAGVPHLGDVAALKTHTARLEAFAADHPGCEAVQRSLARWRALFRLFMSNVYAKAQDLGRRLDQLGTEASNMALHSMASRSGARACQQQLDELGQLVNRIAAQLPTLVRQVNRIRWNSLLAQGADNPAAREWPLVAEQLVGGMKQQVDTQVEWLTQMVPGITQSTNVQAQLERQADLEASQARALLAQAAKLAEALQRQADQLRLAGPEWPACTAVEVLGWLRSLPAAHEPWCATDLALLAQASQLVAIGPWPEGTGSASHDLPIVLFECTVAALRHGCGLTAEGARFATGPWLDELDPAVLIQAFDALYEADKIKLVSGPVTRSTLPLQTAFARHPRIAVETRRDTVARILAVRSPLDTPDEWDRLHRLWTEELASPGAPV